MCQAVSFTVTPCGSAGAVIHSTCSFSNLQHLHNLECRGIIDRDFRTDEQVNYLAGSNVFCLAVSEIENLFLLEQVLRCVAVSLNMEDLDSIVEEAKELVFHHMRKDKERLISAIVTARIEKKFLDFNAKALGELGIKKALEDSFAAIDVSFLYTETSNSVDSILDTRNYSEALRLYNNKGLLPQVSGLFGFKAHELTEYIKRLILSKNNRSIVDSLQKAFSEFPKPKTVVA